MSGNPFEEETPNQRLISPQSIRSSGNYGNTASGSPNMNNNAYVQPQQQQQPEAFSDQGDGSGVYNPELNFQNFQHTSVTINDPGNKIGSGGSSAILQEHSVDFSEDPSAPPQGVQPLTLEQPAANLHFWNVQFYAHLFNVSTNDVFTRVLRSMLPFKFSFVETVKSNPDFYGPFWISTTLIFILAAAGNLYSYLKTSHSKDDLSGWTYDFNLVTVGAIAIYGYVMAIPVILWAVLKWLKVPLKLIDTICIYGYSLFIYIPVSIVCVIPVGIMQWILVMFACALSGWFLVSNLMVPIKNASQTKEGLVVLGVVGALHIGLALLYRLYFFTHS